MATDLANVAAEKARDVAEEYFKLLNTDMAIKSIQAAQMFNPNLQYVNRYTVGYQIHQIAARKGSWYEILFITDQTVESSEIKSKYKFLALILHPDKNPSAAAAGAFNLIQSAADVLTDPGKRKAYDNSLRLKKQYSTFTHQFSSKKTAPGTNPKPYPKPSFNDGNPKSSTNSAPKRKPSTQPDSTPSRPKAAADNKYSKTQGCYTSSTKRSEPSDKGIHVKFGDQHIDVSADGRCLNVNSGRFNLSVRL